MSNQPPTDDQIRAAARAATMQILRAPGSHDGQAVAAALAYAERLPPARPTLAAALIEDLAAVVIEHRLTPTDDDRARAATVIEIVTSRPPAEAQAILACILADARRRGAASADAHARRVGLQFAIELAEGAPSGTILDELRAALAEIEAQQ